MNFILTLIYLINIFISILSSILLLIVIYLLQRFDVFHFNLRNLISHSLICIFINNCIQILRIILPLCQAFMSTSNEEMAIINLKFNYKL
uniref:Candidate secreted effector n=1 Tax=Meloidogyne incognita TaxID=6306 RepID=A0A914L319_MELIC